MKLTTNPGFHELTETIGENGEFVFTLKIPGNFTWEMLDHVIVAMGAGAKEWRSLVEKKSEEVNTTPEVAESIETVTPEVIA